MTVMEEEGAFFMLSEEVGRSAQTGAIMVASQTDQLGHMKAQSVEEIQGLLGRGRTVHDVAHEDEALGLVIG